MIYAFPQYFESKSQFLSYAVVKDALEKAGHSVVDGEGGDYDAVLFSICDSVEYRKLIATRRKYRDRPLIVGGAFAFNFKSAKLYSDGVWVGEVYEMAECKTLDQLLESKHCYTGDEYPTASQKILWETVPIVRESPTRAYYWGGVGCSNKCKFCFTSWTHRHQVNPRRRVQAAIRAMRKKKLHLMVCSNEYENDPGAKTFDMLMNQYAKTPCSKASVVRCGIEFATEASRRKMGKPISDDDIRRAIRKAAKERVNLKLFHITGYDTIEEWEAYLSLLASACDASDYGSRLDIGMNNLEYQNYTPLYSERKSIDPSRYVDHTTAAHWHRQLLIGGCKHPHVIAPKPFQHVCCRMGIEHSTTLEQAEFWASMLVNPKKKLTTQQAYDALFDTGIMDTPALTMIHSSGKIIDNPKWQ